MLLVLAPRQQGNSDSTGALPPVGTLPAGGEGGAS
eukprot:COSAG02_NODE_25586_length_654_cov_0.951351_1_plen_34_part_10